MQISNIIHQFTDALSLGQKPETAAAAVKEIVQSPEAESATPGARKALAEILRTYDVSDITPEDFSRLLKKLSEAGAITEKELYELSAIRLDLENAGVDSDESVDLLEFYSEKIRKTQREFEPGLKNTAGQQRLSPLLSRMAWLEKFSLIHSNPDAVGMDLAA